MSKSKCEWEMIEDDCGGFYQTACSDAFVFDTGGITENSFIYCPFCGKAINETKQVILEEE